MAPDGDAVRRAVASREAVGHLEALVTRDEGGRGIAPLVQPDVLRQAAAALVDARKVAVATGFPCLIAADGSVRGDVGGTPQETDGPPGAVAIAKAVLALDPGAEVALLTDEVSAPVLLACVGAALGEAAARVAVHAFPPRGERSEAEWDAAWGGLLETGGFDHLVAIERAGPAADGRCYTMGGKDMTHLLAPLEQLFLRAAAAGVPTTAIGDGGNELGMGNVAPLVRRHIPGGAGIACVTEVTHLIVASVSNWGGYALAAAMAAEVAARAPDAVGVPDAMLVTAEEARATLAAAVAAGARDGIVGTAAPDLLVDGFGWDVQARVLRALRAALCAA
eukprot:TRINITY_DN8147_c0_g1_i2.p1 TRINITY_DN8147_c0_g1~~TRINITY_DN8147_c0_g1_i2.p1  ORF type:complete len:336 (+),score=94.32 TRINITY_DN8147_c0_g1_i2:65-1072(+)